MSNKRTLTREQLEAWGLPYETASVERASAGTANLSTTAVELHREQVDTRRWYSVHRLVFRAPDDGQPWAIIYFQGLTENQEGTDPWNEQQQVTATRMERYQRTVTDWREASGG